MSDPIRLETWGIVDAVLDDRTNLSGRWIAEGIAWYSRPAAPHSNERPIELLVPTGLDPIAPLVGWRYEGETAWRSPQVDVHPQTGEVGGGDSADGHRTSVASKPKKPRWTSERKKAAAAKRTRGAVQKVLDYLSEHPSDAILSTDTLYTKLNKQVRLKVGRSSVGKALGIARLNGRE